MKSKHLFLIAISLSSLLLAQAAEENVIMPAETDYVSMWWQDGFPGVVEKAPWHRWMQSGSYAFVLDTEKLLIPYLGPTSSFVSEADLGGIKNPVRLGEQAADLDLTLTVDGQRFRGLRGGEWSRHGGPRLIESGRFLQRSDITGLEFEDKNGSRLNVEATLETVAWSDRLSLILSARPALQPIQFGEKSFGKLGGGFGLDGNQILEIPSNEDWDAEKFTFGIWVYVPLDYDASETGSPWLVCKNRNQSKDGHYGISIQRGMPRVHLNVGGGSANKFTLSPRAKTKLQLGEWSHLAMSYDGESLRLFLNGTNEGELAISRMRKVRPGGLAIGGRQDRSGDGGRIRGVVDEVVFYKRALSAQEVSSLVKNPQHSIHHNKPSAHLGFREKGKPRTRPQRAEWKSANLQVALKPKQGGRRMAAVLKLDEGDLSSDGGWHQVALVLDPTTMEKVGKRSSIKVQAKEIATGEQCSVSYDSDLACHLVNLDSVKAVPRPGGKKADNDVLERVQVSISNPSELEKKARLIFKKSSEGHTHSFGSWLTGVTVILRDKKGNPIGLPVQLSKNWHRDKEAGTHQGPWLHGITQLRLPPKSSYQFELTVCYGHWGGLPAASHSQLSLIGWGQNQLWDQSALGSWGESVCYDPEQVNAACTITDVRPLMVTSKGKKEQWGWTNNVGGGDFFRFFAPDGKRVPHGAVRTIRHRNGPCLTEVIYEGRIGSELTHSTTASLARTDDLVRATYRIRLDVSKAVDFSRLVFFQTGADTYLASRQRRFAYGNENGLIKDWEATWGGDIDRTKPVEMLGQVPWISLHQAAPQIGEQGASANKGVVIREWRARIGGKDVLPWIVERGAKRGAKESSNIDLVPPPGVTRLEQGDFVEAIIEFLVVPQFGKDYYGSNQELRSALGASENSWRMVQREALSNDRKVEVKTGSLLQRFPDIRIQAQHGNAAFELSQGLGFVPITIIGLKSPQGCQLLIDGKEFDQSVHGNDFWQADFDVQTRTWSRTYNIPCSQKVQSIQLQSIL